MEDTKTEYTHIFQMRSLLIYTHLDSADVNLLLVQIQTNLYLSSYPSRTELMWQKWKLNIRAVEKILKLIMYRRTYIHCIELNIGEKCFQ
jgi:hypothetical protein